MKIFLWLLVCCVSLCGVQPSKLNPVVLYGTVQQEFVPAIVVETLPLRQALHDKKVVGGIYKSVHKHDTCGACKKNCFRAFHVTGSCCAAIGIPCVLMPAFMVACAFALKGILW
jgi:hypothetical protein